MKNIKALNVLLRGISVSFIAVIMMASSVSASTVFLQPGPDQGLDANWYSYPNSPLNLNYGYLNNLEIGTTASFQGRSLLKFDIPAEVIGRTIQSATFEIYAQSIYYNARGGTIYANRATSAWEELEGAYFNPPTYDSLYRASSIIPFTHGTWVSFDITDMMDYWASYSSQNFGMVLSSPADYTYYTSSDYSNAILRPKLTIEYSAGNLVPEPATMVLVGLGGVAMAAINKRRKK